MENRAPLSEINGEEDSLEKLMGSISHLASLGELGGSIAHEINNPLNIICGFSELLIEQVKRNEEAINQAAPGALNNLKKIEKAAERIATVTNYLKKLCTPPEPYQGLTSVNALIRQSFAILEQQFSNRGINQEFQLCSESTEIKAQPRLMEQAFILLATSARDSVTQRHGRSGGSLTVKSYVNNSQVIVELQDNGVLLSEIEIKRLFTFRHHENQTSFIHKNNLAFARQILAQHQGQISGEANHLDGLTITIKLPQNNP